MMSVGEFATRAELLANALGRYVVVEEGSDEAVEVFSREELAAQRQLTELLESSETRLNRMEEVRKSAAEGRISKDEMMKQLEELKRQQNQH